MQTSTVFRFNTDSVPAKDRLAVWREVVGRQYMHLDIEPDESVPLQAELEVHNLPSTTVAFFRSTPTKYFRNQLQAHSGDGDFTFVSVARERFGFSSEGQDTTFNVGECALLFHGRSGTVEIPHDGRTTGVRINGSMLRSAVRNLDERAMHRFHGNDAPLRLFLGYVDVVLRSGQLEDQALAHAVNLHLVDLIALGLRPTAETVERARAGAVRSARLHAVLKTIAQEATDTALDPSRVATRLGFSVRYLHRLLEETGLTFSEHVLGRRIERAHRLLRDPRLTHLKINEIALEAGFADLSHFNRSFRARFGDTPSAVRAEAARRENEERGG